MTTMLVTTVAFAQAQNKIGYIDLEALIYQMPDMQHVRQQLKAFTQTKQQAGQKLLEAYQTKQQKYSEEAPTQTQNINKQRGEELQALQQKIQLEARKAEQEVQQKQAELMNPLLNKVQKAIDSVANKAGYDIVLKSEAVIYFKDQADNLAPKVMKLLGIKSKK